MYIVSLKTSPNMIFQDAGDISPTPKYRQPLKHNTCIEL